MNLFEDIYSDNTSQDCPVCEHKIEYRIILKIEREKSEFELVQGTCGHVWVREVDP